jgi:hypothetical protein
MSSATNVAHSPSAAPARSSSRSWPRIFLIAGVIAVVLILVGSILCAKFWPFSEKSVLEDLSEASDSTVTIRSYHPTYFPVPGCVLYGVEFRHGKEQRELITIEKLRIMGSYPGVLRQYVPRIIAEGARVTIPPFGSNVVFSSQHSTIKIDEIVANGTLVQFVSGDPQAKPFTFDVHDALLSDVRWGSPISYRLRFHNPNPPGEILVSGKFGAWADGHPNDTPISGDYTFEQADLSVYGGIAGLLSSKGRFEGLLKHINVSGTTDTPDFEVTSSGHKVDLRTQFQAYVDGTNGDTFLNHVDAKFGRTTVAAEGSIAHSDGHSGKLTNVHLSSRNARVEDLLGLFVTDPRSPMLGPISLDARAQWAGDDPFLQKLRIGGEFLIHEARFAQPDTQLDVDKLSAGAQGKNKDAPDDVVTDLKGKTAMEHAVANFSDIDFQIPGAHAKLHGTYNVENQKVDLHGNMRVDTQISKTSTGMKAFVLKMMDPLFRKKKKGEVVPIHIMGTYEKPEFGLDMTKNSQQKPARK